jgi:hypothetical protein
VVHQAVVAVQKDRAMRDYNNDEEVPSLELTEQDLVAVTGGTFEYSTMKWEYTKQDDTGAAKGK